MTNDGNTQYLYNADGQICAVKQQYESMTVMTGCIYDATGVSTDRSSSVGWSNGERVAKGFTPEFVKP